MSLLVTIRSRVTPTARDTYKLSVCISNLSLINASTLCRVAIHILGLLQVYRKRDLALTLKYDLCLLIVIFKVTINRSFVRDLICYLQAYCIVELIVYLTITKRCVTHQ